MVRILRNEGRGAGTAIIEHTQMRGSAYIGLPNPHYITPSRTQETIRFHLETTSQQTIVSQLKFHVLHRGGKFVKKSNHYFLGRNGPRS